ncbi:MAG: T9SS type A sorting domain-containing protein [Ferruginibacter sp.]|nr:T9SS type A sorting domain-containing protein [Ferruginibacter sp.]
MNFKLLLTGALLTSTIVATAQNANRGYAITGDGNNDFLWMNIRQVNLGTGQVSNTIFDRSKTAFTITDVASKKTLNQISVNDGTVASASLYPTNSFVAAAAYDRRSEKLFFIPMRMGQLRWMDANIKNDAPAFYSVVIPNYLPSANADEANNITRMVIGADNNGYAVTNDGNHLYSFSTGKNPVIKDLGALVDAEENKGLSIHNKCSSWGGDMIADAFGKLYIIAASKNVFVVDVNSRLTTYKGTITGLPANYTTNGAAVDADGNIILSSATAFVGYYKMNIADLVATKIEGSDMVYNASDLASGNLLLQKEADLARNNSLAKLLPATINTTNENSVFPNPITGSTFNVLLAGKLSGNYSVRITDLAGRAVQNTKATVSKGQQVQQINFNVRPTAGTYLVKILDEKGTEILSDKLMVL